MWVTLWALAWSEIIDDTHASPVKGMVKDLETAPLYCLEREGCAQPALTRECCWWSLWKETEVEIISGICQSCTTSIPHLHFCHMNLFPRKVYSHFQTRVQLQMLGVSFHWQHSCSFQSIRFKSDSIKCFLEALW